MLHVPYLTRDNHARVHDDEKPRKCTNYSNEFTTSRICTDEKPYKCTECDKEFSNFSHFYLQQTI